MFNRWMQFRTFPNLNMSGSLHRNRAMECNGAYRILQVCIREQTNLLFPIFRFLLVIWMFLMFFGFCQLGTNNTAELSAFGEEGLPRDCIVDVLWRFDVSWHCDTLIYIVSWLCLCVRWICAYVILCHEFHATNLGINEVNFFMDDSEWSSTTQAQFMLPTSQSSSFIARPCYGCVMKHPLTQGEQQWCTMTRSMPRRLPLANCDFRTVERVKLCVCNLPCILTNQSYCHEHSHQLTVQRIVYIDNRTCAVGSFCAPTLTPRA